MSETRVLLLGDPTSDAIAAVLSGQGRTLTRSADPDEAIRLAPDMQLVVVDVVPPPRTVADVCRALRETQALAEVPVLAITTSDDVESRIRLLEAGADDVMARPIDSRELEARIEALERRYQRSRELRPTTRVTTRRSDRHVVVVFSPKGGVGTTTVAVNLALSLTARYPEQVALVDLSGGTGDVATHLNLRAGLTMAELARDIPAIHDPELMRMYLARHPSALQVLAGSASPAMPPLSGDTVVSILDGTLALVPTVVVDAGSTLDEATTRLLQLADDAVLVVSPDFPALRSMHAMLDHFRDLGTPLTGTTIVLNELFAREMLTLEDVEGALLTRVAIRIPYDPLLYLKAANVGSPVVEAAPGSMPARRFEELTSALVGDAPTVAAAPRKRQGLGRLFSRGS